jgi:short subunit dehydrogenase-like uncharacterized protein
MPGRPAVPCPALPVAQAISWGTAATMAALNQKWLQPVLKRMLPAPGEGPSRDAMLNGYYKHKVVGYTQVGHSAHAGKCWVQLVHVMDSWLAAGHAQLPSCLALCAGDGHAGLRRCPAKQFAR